MRILLADDHPLFAESLRSLVERNLQPCDLAVVSDIPAADRALSAGPRYDLAILDLHMPDANGFDGIKRTLERFPGTPIVVISGAATPADVSRAIELGAKGFLPKTLPSQALAAAIRVVLSGGTYVPADYAQAGAAPAAAPPAPAAGRLPPPQNDVPTP